MNTIKKRSMFSYNPSMKRREFLGKLAVTASVAGIITACNKDDGGGSSNGGIDLGSGDVGILNYAYALEQLEAAFYTAVIDSQYSGISSDEVALLTDIRDHEVGHREFFKAALGSAAIPGLEVDFSSIDFSSRDSVLGTAKAFEDLGVSAYNGAGKLIASTDYLLVAGKIVSVEARHAAYIRDLISYGSFADNSVIDRWVWIWHKHRTPFLQQHLLSLFQNWMHLIYQPIKNIKMNLKNIFNQIENADPEIYERIDDRRAVMHRFKNIGGKLALTAVPAALGGMLNRAYGQTPISIVDILNFALTLEYLEADFYNMATAASGLIAASEVASFNLIKKHENAHVDFLKSTITTLGGSPVAKPEFDFTAGGAFPTVFTITKFFLPYLKHLKIQV